ncbi:MAG TPA: hypothetical protein VGH08_04170 [Chthoniobacterales bacterium]|jgi:hypothetical protein
MLVSVKRRGGRIASEINNDFKASYNHRVRKIREAATAALKELSLFRSAELVSQEALDVEAARIAKEKLRPYGCDLVVRRMNDGVTRFLIKVLSTGRSYDLIKNFFHRDDGSPFRLRHSRK